MRVIGWDSAVDAKKCGIAFGTISANGITVESVETGLADEALVDAITSDINAHSPCLLAIDAPLGWPAALGQALAGHVAGGALAHAAHDLFRRNTDGFIKQAIGKQPLDVGADRIARTALAVLQRLETLRANTGQALPLAWVPGELQDPACIEVYPAGTLKVCGLPATGYKGREADKQAARDRLVEGLADFLDIPAAVATRMRANDDALDAVVCLLAGYDFMQGKVMPPADPVLAKKEGWIWVRG